MRERSSNEHRKASRELSPERTEEWLDNFEADEQLLMGKLVPHLQLFETDRIVELIAEAFENLLSDDTTIVPEQALFSGVGDEGSSSGMSLLYPFEKNQRERGRNIDANRFPRDLKQAAEQRTQRGPLILIDDFLGSGTQSCEYFNDHIKGLGFKKVYYIAGIGSREAIDTIKRNTKSLTAYCGQYLDESYRAFTTERKSSIWQDDEERCQAEKIAKEYGEQLFPKAPLGKGGCQYLIRFQHNVPHNTLPIIWASKEITLHGKKKNFNALCPRTVDDPNLTLPQVITELQTTKSPNKLIAIGVRDQQRANISRISHGQRRLLYLVEACKGTRSELYERFREDKSASKPTLKEVKFRLYCLCFLGLVDYHKSGDDKVFTITPTGREWVREFKNRE